MSDLIPYLPLDLSGTSPINLVANEEQPVLDVDGIAYPVVTLTNGGFYTNGLEVRDKDFNELTPNTDYIATYKHKDASDYTGLEICSAIIILNPELDDTVYVTAQMVGGDLAFSLSVREDTYDYLRGLDETIPRWAGFLGAEPQWEDGELRRDRWQLAGVESFIFELENIVRGMKEGDPEAEDLFRQYALSEYNTFMDGWSTGLNQHVTNESNPHVDTKDMIGLKDVVNLPVATKAIAEQGTSNAHYLTPGLFFDEADALYLPSLTNHIGDFNNPHAVTAEQLQVYTTQQLDALIASKLATDETAVDSKLYNGASYLARYNEARANLDAALFTSGIMQPSMLGVGGYNSEYVLMANGQWVALSTLFQQYGAGEGTKILYVGNQGSVSTALNACNATFSDINAYPVGTFVIWRHQHTEYYGNGNGVSSVTVNPTRAIVRTTSGYSSIA